MIITFEVVHVSDMAPGTENTSLLILTTTLRDWYYNSQFTDEEAEAHKVQITCPKSNDQKNGETRIQTHIPSKAGIL